MEPHCSRQHNANRQHRQNRRPLSCVSRRKRSATGETFYILTKKVKSEIGLGELYWDVRAHGAEEVVQLWAIWQNTSGCNSTSLVCVFIIQVERKEKKKEKKRETPDPVDQLYCAITLMSPSCQANLDKAIQCAWTFATAPFIKGKQMHSGTLRILLHVSLAVWGRPPCCASVLRGAACGCNPAPPEPCSTYSAWGQPGRCGSLYFQPLNGGSVRFHWNTAKHLLCMHVCVHVKLWYCGARH